MSLTAKRRGTPRRSERPTPLACRRSDAVGVAGHGAPVRFLFASLRLLGTMRGFGWPARRHCTVAARTTTSPEHKEDTCTWHGRRRKTHCDAHAALEDDEEAIAVEEQDLEWRRQQKELVVWQFFTILPGR
ncbi:hypothetical protein NDU88_004373 [Pleurodeles waltl]|uniref:Uncharacterized protein n=1 Tax=Pleurodeles waltl TaxID=8319 RepID=A0AAV7NM10_PLEWA|nr:hypothetical protein NDU88_004373 [Pleurodeles waltl]